MNSRERYTLSDIKTVLAGYISDTETIEKIALDLLEYQLSKLEWIYVTHILYRKDYASEWKIYKEFLGNSNHVLLDPDSFKKELANAKIKYPYVKHINRKYPRVNK